jgi:hypothetical protein
MALDQTETAMAFRHQPQVRAVHGLTTADDEAISNFLQGAVYCRVKNEKDKEFAAHDLMGGENWDWDGTPLYALYEKQHVAGKSNADAIDAAGKDLGWMLLKVLDDDKRHFVKGRKGLVNSYQWEGNEP